MANIWAYRKGAFNAGGGWDEVIDLPRTDNLVYLQQRLDSLGLRNGVNRLGLVFHGDAGGVVQSDPPIDQASMLRIGVVTRFIVALRDYLAPNAQVTFFSCISGAGPQGSVFLQTLSAVWPGREVVGFVTSGWVDPQHFVAGDVFDVGTAISGPVPSGLITRDSRGRLTLPRMDSKSRNAKVAINGAIKRMPLREQLLAP